MAKLRSLFSVTVAGFGGKVHGKKRSHLAIQVVPFTKAWELRSGDYYHQDFSTSARCLIWEGSPLSGDTHLFYSPKLIDPVFGMVAPGFPQKTHEATRLRSPHVRHGRFSWLRPSKSEGFRVAHG